MSNLGRAIYMAGSVFLFIIAATASIYLYGTLNEYLDISASGVDINNRAEVSVVDGSKKQRNIDKSEIYITLFNMEQMYVEKLIVDGKEVTSTDVLENNTALKSVLNFLKSNPNLKYTYSCSGSIVTYTPRSS